MTTTQNPSCSCNAQTVSPVDQPQQTDDQPPELAEWPVYMCSVPADWEPKSGSALPPNAKRFNNGRIAVEVATMLNREILKQSTDGTVQSWFIRISKRSEVQGVISVSIPAYLGWKPVDAHDMPPAQLTIKGMLADARREVAAMNQALSDDQYKEHRFYIGFSISAVPEWKQKPAQPEKVEADPVKDQERKKEFGTIYLVDIPSDYDASSSWKALPSLFQKVKNKEIAKIAAVGGNQRILNRSQDGTVQSWYAVVEAVGGFGIVQISLPDGWKPADVYDMPKAFNMIEGRKERTEYIKTLNQQLDRITNKKSRKRAYSALRVFRPETTEDQPDAKPEPQTVPAERKPISAGTPVADWEQFIPQGGNPVTVSGIRYASDDRQPLTAVDLLKRHGLEIHQVNVDQREKRIERFLSEMK
ncbi:hypothetical protein [Gimesia sp.]|uniref:hypothetical protein n=1 Tax=Gimesia sp. TaxID=2024833 RepID=UPI003A93AC61